ncbi:MAG: PAS domain-containing protein [Bacteroidota bacterium]
MRFYKSSAYSNPVVASLTQYLAEQYAPIVLFVNKQLDILYTNGDISQFLTFPKALAQFNVAKMLKKEGVIIFKNCVDRALEENTATLYKDYALTNRADTRYADFYFQKFKAPGADQSVVMVRVLIHTSPAEAKNFPRPESDANINERLDLLEKEVDLSQEKKRALMNELEATNEELKTSNGELMASNEELVSTNEELQSVNEEIHTVNSELQLKNEELLMTQTDINNMLESTDIGILFLDSKYNINKFNDPVKEHYDLTDADVGRSITDFRSHFREIQLKAIAQSVYNNLEPFEREVVSDDGRFYLLRVLPYRTSKDQIKGVVVTFLDVNDLVRARVDRLEVADKFRAVFNNIQDIVISLYEDGTIRNINKSFVGYEKQELLNRKLADFFPRGDRKKLNEHLSIIKKEDVVRRDAFVLSQKRNGKKQYFDTTFMSSLSTSKLPEEKKAANTLLILKDKTETIERKEALEETLQLYHTFMGYARQQIVLVDQSHHVIYINRGIDKRADIAAPYRHISHYLPEEAVTPYTAYIDSIFEGNTKNAKLTITIKNEDQEAQIVEYIGIPIATTSGIDYVATISDTTI